ncbi:MAG: hypothetical protein ABIB79_05170 [archaeon]
MKDGDFFLVKDIPRRVREEGNRRSQFQKKLFGEGGYLNLDGDCMLNSPEEKWEFCRRAGLIDRIKFPALRGYEENINVLERVVQSYEAENQ